MIGTQTAEKTEVQTLLTELLDRTQELYASTCRTIQPTKGWVLIRVLEREQVTQSGIIVPGIEQNKPLHEGIVLATWEPWIEERTMQDEDGKKLTKVIQHKSDLKPGDHVLIDHWCGVPVEGDSKINTKFRLVKEEPDPNLGSVKAVVEYTDKDNRPHEILSEMLWEIDPHGQVTDFERLCRLVAAKISDKFLLVDRDMQSVTLSGR
jgi:co-chaperonin GroES (HSP10)